VSPNRSTLRSEDGQALAEFALVLPLLVLLLFGMLDFGKAFNYWNDATHLSAEGARFAVVDRKPDPASTASLQAQIRDQADTAELRNGGTPAVGSPAQVCIDFPNGTTNVGDPVRVRMRFTYNWLPFIGGGTPLPLTGGGIKIAQTTISATSVMRLEAKPTTYSPGCA
jgi:Flp pilus assembly protein TadG